MDSKWDQQWKDFRDSDPVLHQFFKVKMKCAKSNNALSWASLHADSQDPGLGDSQGHSKMMDAEAWLITTFQAQSVMVIKNPRGKVVESDLDKVLLNVVRVGALPRPG